MYKLKHEHAFNICMRLLCLFFFFPQWEKKTGPLLIFNLQDIGYTYSSIDYRKKWQLCANHFDTKEEFFMIVKS